MSELRWKILKGDDRARPLAITVMNAAGLKMVLQYRDGLRHWKDVEVEKEGPYPGPREGEK